MHSGRNIAILGAIAAMASVGGGQTMTLSAGPECTTPRALKPSAAKARPHHVPVPNKTNRGKRRHQTKRR